MKITFRKYFIKNREIPGMSRNGLRKFSAGLILSALLALLLAFPVPASANSPSDVQLTYLDKEQTLQVKITHKSFVPNSHYIAKVEIQKNSEKPLVYEYKSQSD
ncbi:MAG: hypothetical protein ABRQ33_11670, partial [Smithellaceae bacterium]